MVIPPERVPLSLDMPGDAICHHGLDYPVRGHGGYQGALHVLPRALLLLVSLSKSSKARRTFSSSFLYASASP